MYNNCDYNCNLCDSVAPTCFGEFPNIDTLFNKINSLDLKLDTMYTLKDFRNEYRKISMRTALSGIRLDGFTWNYTIRIYIDTELIGRDIIGFDLLACDLIATVIHIDPKNIMIKSIELIDHKTKAVLKSL